MKRYRQTIVAYVECLLYAGQITYPVPIAIACETRLARIGSAIAATLRADEHFADWEPYIVGFRIRIGSLIIGVDSLGSFVHGFGQVA